MQVLTSRCRATACAGALALCGIGQMGCKSYSETSFVYVNLTQEDIYIEAVKGVEPDPTPGVVASGDGSQLAEKSWTTYEGVKVEQQIEITNS